MLISTKHLKAAGCDVRVTSGPGKAGPLNDADLYVEINLKNGKPLPPEVNDAILNLVPPEYGEAVVEALVQKIHIIQILEVIRGIERSAWGARHRE